MVALFTNMLSEMESPRKQISDYKISDDISSFLLDHCSQTVLNAVKAVGIDKFPEENNDRRIKKNLKNIPTGTNEGFS